jgi:hypothetical protein
MSFPQDRYTPYGYLDLPNHARRLRPLGVLRSEGVGFLWHFPAYAGGYGGRRPHYIAGLWLSLDGTFKIEDFDEVYCPYHSKNCIEFRIRKRRVSAQIVFHPIGEHVLRCCLEISGKGRARVGVHVAYRRLIGATGEWGESGLVGRLHGDLLVLQGFESGEAFLIDCTREPEDRGLSTQLGEMMQWKDQPGPGIEGALAAQAKGGQIASLFATLGFGFDLGGEPQSLEVLMARGLTVPRAQVELNRAKGQGEREEARRRSSDDRFWERAPKLKGDWPEHWRRGLVYDLETVRMMVKPPIGIYRYPWDAMQIQSPRVVLAEAAIDALLLGYADPTIAQQLLLGAFADAPEPNVPCSREDGSYNMVSADGSACGTAPSWGYPWLAIEQLAALHPNHAWVAQIYPHLGAYLDWWLAYRSDEGGWISYACSWESGQDGSPRFGEQPLGEGGPTWHIRPADLQAAFAHAAGLMARLAETLGRPRDKLKWETLARTYRDRTGRLWTGTRYADYDTRQGKLTEVSDLMLLAPLALGIASPERVETLRPLVERLDPDTLTWPMFAWTATEAALQAGLLDKASELGAAVCERVYGFWDAREISAERTIPGIACEYWPLSGKCGGEGYGWGAFCTHVLLHVLVGLSFNEAKLVLRPNLPLKWRRPGRCYRVQWHARGRPVEIALEPLRGSRVRVTLNEKRSEAGWGEEVAYAWEEL